MGPLFHTLNSQEKKKKEEGIYTVALVILYKVEKYISILFLSLGVVPNTRRAEDHVPKIRDDEFDFDDDELLFDVFDVFISSTIT